MNQEQRDREQMFVAAYVTFPEILSLITREELDNFIKNG